MLFGGGGGGGGPPFLLLAGVLAGALTGVLVVKWHANAPDFQLRMKKVGDMITVTANDENYRNLESVFKTKGLECLAAKGFPSQYAGFYHDEEVYVTTGGKTAEAFREACTACDVHTEAIYRYPRQLFGGYTVQNNILEWSQCPVSELK